MRTNTGLSVLKNMWHSDRLFRAGLWFVLAYSAGCAACFALSSLAQDDGMSRCAIVSVLLCTYLMYVKKKKIATGFRRTHGKRAVDVLFYLPLILVLVSCYGMFDESMTASSALVFAVTALLASVLQESIFRGVVLPTMRQHMKLMPCVLMIAVSLCLDELMFPCAGVTVPQLFIRLGIDYAVGVMLAVMAQLQENVRAGTVFHFLFLLIRHLTTEPDVVSNTGPMLAVIVICILYCWYMCRRMQRQTEQGN